MTMRVTRILGVTIAALVALSVCACGKKDAPAEGEKKVEKAADKADKASAKKAEGDKAAPPAEPVKPQKVVLWHSYRAEEAKGLDSLVSAWNSKHPEIQIETLAVPFDAFADKITVSVPRGNGPDLFIYAHDRIGDWADKNLIEPLGDWATPEMLARFMPQTVKPLVYKKALYGLPLAFKSLVLFYNTKLVPKAPETMAQLIEVAKAHTSEKEGKFGLVYNAANLYFHAAWLHGEKGIAVDEEGAIQLDTPEAEKALTLARDLNKKHGIMPKSSMDDFVIKTTFNEGKAAMMLNGPWVLGELNPGLQFGVAVLPKLDSGEPAKPFLGSEALLLSKHSQVKEAAKRVLDYLASDEAALTRLKGSRQMVANVKTYENPQVLEDPVVKIFRAQADAAVPMSTLPVMAVVWDPYNQALQKAIFGTTEPKQALADAQKRALSDASKMGK